MYRAADRFHEKSWRMPLDWSRRHAAGCWNAVSARVTAPSSASGV